MSHPVPGREYGENEREGEPLDNECDGHLVFEGKCIRCGKPCAICNGTGKVEVYRDEYENGQLVGVGTMGPYTEVCECQVAKIYE